MDLGKKVMATLAVGALSALVAGCTPKRMPPVNTGDLPLTEEQAEFANELSDRIYMNGSLLYEVKEGDTFGSVADAVNKRIRENYCGEVLVSPIDIIFYAGIDNPDKLKPGTFIEIPIYQEPHPVVDELIEEYVKTHSREDLFNATH